MNFKQVSGTKYIYRLLLLASVLLLPVSTWAAQTVHIKLTIDGNAVEGESTVSSLEREGTIEASSAGFSVSLPVDSSGLPTGRHTYRPYVITKRIDKSSPLLFKALTNGEPVDELEAMYFRPSPSGSGAEEKFQTILLRNGRITSIIQTSEDAIIAGESAPPVMETVSFIFEQITMIYEIGGVEHTDIIGVVR